jgi:trans-aconitate 2-methyltransferase
MKENDWQPGLYMRFAKQRTQPSIDLVNRITLTDPHEILDVGCGPGNSTQVLFEKWRNSNILGVDSSPAMIEKARHDFPFLQWAEMDANNLQFDKKFDIVFSNATIQWLPDHKKVLNDFWNVLAPGGCMAVQVPLHHQMPVSRLIEEVAAEGAWKEKLKGAFSLFTFHDPGFYYDVLTALTKDFSLWETDYFHVMDTHAEIVEMMKSTGMKPYTDRLSTTEEKQLFEAKVLEKITAGYPAQADGKVLLPFKRLFFTANKP